MIVVKKQDTICEPQVGTLWVDTAGGVYFLHRVVPTVGHFTLYQMTRLQDGKPWATGNSTGDLIHRMALCSCSVEIRNESIEETE